MNAVLHNLGIWFWRLVPANPILVRVVLAGGRRVRHLWIRMGYLSVMALAVVIGVFLTQSSTTAAASLADLAKSATRVFQNLAQLQLALVCILAPIFTAAAITQEKDSQTFNILLSTPLTDGQIVLGSLLSRLYFVIVLLVASIPLFCIMMVYGGVTGDRIFLANAIAAATATLTGALAIMISVIRIGTGRTVFTFYLAIAIYLIVVYSLSSWSRLIPPEAVPAPDHEERMSWLAAFHPFLALNVVLGTTPAPEMEAVIRHGFPGKYLLAYPQYSYLFLTLGASLVLVVFSRFFVRRGAKEGEPTFFNRVFGKSARRGGESGEGAAGGDGDDRAHKPRHVYHNPIAWRESVTSASAAGGSGLRYILLATGLLVAIVLLVYYLRGDLTDAETRKWLYGLVAVELGITLFIAVTSAATSMTREKESGTLELVLATPLTSAKIIRGKVMGLVTAAWPMLLLPYVTTLLFLCASAMRGKALIHVETLLSLPILLVSFTAFACAIGLQYSIKCKKTLAAVFISSGWVMGVFLVLAGCALTMRESDQGVLVAAFMPLSPVTAPWVVIDPADAVSSATNASGVGDAEVYRIAAFIAAICSAAVYALVGLALHKSMVRNFDMTIRKQSA